MTFVAHTLEWVRALLLAPRKRGMTERARTAPTHVHRPVQPRPYAAETSPEAWGAVLVLARLRRARDRSIPTDVQRDDGKAHPLVRAYVFQPGERRRFLLPMEFTGASR